MFPGAGPSVTAMVKKPKAPRIHGNGLTKYGLWTYSILIACTPMAVYKSSQHGYLDREALLPAKDSSVFVKLSSCAAVLFQYTIGVPETRETRGTVSLLLTILCVNVVGHSVHACSALHVPTSCPCGRWWPCLFPKRSLT